MRNDQKTAEIENLDARHVENDTNTLLRFVNILWSFTKKGENIHFHSKMA